MTHPVLQLKPMSLDDFEECLADQPEGERWELINGRVVRMMVGARWEHNRIINNLGYELRRRFEEMNSPCRVFTETFRLQDETLRASMLPDLLVACQPLPPGAAALTDPTVVIEVLSDGTAKRDRDEKWSVYRAIASLRHYVLVSRDVPHLEVFDRQGDAWAAYRICDGLDASLDLPAVDVSIPIRRIYRDIFA